MLWSSCYGAARCSVAGVVQPVEVLLMGGGASPATLIFRKIRIQTKDYTPIPVLRIRIYFLKIWARKLNLDPSLYYTEVHLSIAISLKFEYVNEFV